MKRYPLEELVNLLEFEEAARYALSGKTYESIAAGSGAGLTLLENRQAFDRITFRPRVLVDVRHLDLSIHIFGQRLETPILVAPTANQTQVHAEGEAATLRGALAAKTTTVLSSRTGMPLEQIARQAKGAPFWCQVELTSDAGAMRERVQRVTSAGALALCVSAGWPPAMRRGERPAAPIDWATVARLREWSKVPVCIKGIMGPEEARTAVERGAQGLIVSNYGGTLADGAPATIAVLPSIHDAVQGRIPILIDSGFRRGTDVLKALALGAQAVMLGRPILWGLGAFGAAGVQKVLELLQSELALAMGLCGKPNLAAIDRSLVKVHRGGQ